MYAGSKVAKLCSGKCLYVCLSISRRVCVSGLVQSGHRLKLASTHTVCAIVSLCKAEAAVVVETEWLARLAGWLTRWLTGLTVVAAVLHI